MEVIASKFEQGGEVSPMEARLLANDREALTTMCRAILSSPPLIDDLPGMNMPFLLFCGESDGAFPGAKESSELLPDATFVSFPGLDHGQAGSRLDLVIPHIKDFLARVN